MKADEAVIRRAKEIIEDIIYITIATVDSSGQPWNSPVFSAYDDAYDFYWGSSKSSQHSRNIKANPKIFLVIYDSTIPAGAGEGVYALATATELTSEEDIKSAHKLLQGRRPEPYWKLDHFLNRESPIALYKASTQRLWMNDGTRKNDIYEDIRKEVAL